MKVVYQGLLIRSSSRIKFFEDCLEVLQVYSPIQDFFHLIPGVWFNLSPVAIDKGSGVSQGLPKKYFKLVPGNQNRAVSFQLSLLLLLTEVDLIPKKGNCKRDLIQPGGSSGGKIIFILLTEDITLFPQQRLEDLVLILSLAKAFLMFGLEEPLG